MSEILGSSPEDGPAFIEPPPGAARVLLPYPRVSVHHRNLLQAKQERFICLFQVF